LSLAAAGIYSLNVTTGPCTVAKTLSVTVYPLPSPTITSNMPVCEGKQLQLSVPIGIGNTTITTILWKGPLNFNSYYAITSIDSALLAHSGIYTVMVVDNHNC